MPSSAATGYHDLLEGKLIAAVSTGTTTGVTVKVKKINGATPTWPTVAHRLKVMQRTATTSKAEIWQVAAGTTQSGQTVTLGTLTRALSLSDGTNFTGSAGTAQSFAAGADVLLVWDVHDASMTPKLDIANTFTGSGAIRTSSTTTPIVRVNNVTTAQRTAMTADNGDIVYDTDLSQFYKYEGGAWAAVATGTFSNAANNTAGKVDLATAAEVAAGTANDATSGAANVIPVSIVKTSSTGAVNGSVPALNAAVAVDVSIGGTGRTSVTTGALLIGAGTSQMTITGPGTSNQIPTSNGTTIAMADPKDYLKVLYVAPDETAAIGASSTSEVDFDNTYTLSANDAAAGVAYEFFASGKFTLADTGGADNISIRLKAGATQLFLITATTEATNRYWQIHGYLTCQSTGASGAFRPGFLGAFTQTTPTMVSQDGNTSISLDTTGTLVLKCSAQFSQSSGSNAATMYQFIIKRLSSSLS